jgi:hypothetical protein
LYIVNAKENSREFVWQLIMVDGEWCSEWGQGREKSRNRRWTRYQGIGARDTNESELNLNQNRLYPLSPNPKKNHGFKFALR